MIESKAVGSIMKYPVAATATKSRMRNNGRRLGGSGGGGGGEAIRLGDGVVMTSGEASSSTSASGSLAKSVVQDKGDGSMVVRAERACI
jgi:hypothetical protein